MSHETKQTVLLIEADTSLRRLIALGLQYRGMQVIEATFPPHLPTSEAPRPSLLILDVDSRVNSDWSLLATAQTDPYLSSLPTVILAWECPVPAIVANEHQNTPQTHVTCLSKPFDARALHATIEQLLIRHTLPEISPATANLAAQTASPAPSVWPLITAAGLLLAFIGLMGPIVITICGLLIVVAALLLWTLGTNTRAKSASMPAGIGNT